MYERSDRMKKKFILLSFILCLTLIITGCWNSRELNTLGIATVIGIDWEDEKILVTIEVINPRPVKAMLEAKPADLVLYVQGRGDTIFDALRNISLKFDRRIFVSQNKIFIFGEEFAKKGFINHIDVLQRDHEFRETAYMLVAKEKKATDIMGVHEAVEEILGMYMEDIVENKKFNPKGVDVNLSEYLKYYYDSGRQPILGVVDRKEKNVIKKVDTHEGKKEYELVIEGCSIFNKEKLSGYLNGEETRALNFVRNEVKGGVIEFPTPVKNIDHYSTPTPSVKDSSSTISTLNRDKSVFEIIKSKTKSDVEIENGKFILKTKVKMRGMLGDVTGDIDVSNEEAIKLIEESCSKQVKEEIESTIKKVQKKYKTDVFAFGTLVHRKYPKEWHRISSDWNNIFSQADVQVEVETNIIRTGLVNTSTNKIKGE